MYRARRLRISGPPRSVRHRGPSAMNERSKGEHGDEERLSRREAAERLTDIAYGLTAGRIEMSFGGHSVKLPIGDGVMLKRESTSHGARNRVALELSWSTALVSRSPSPKRSRPLSR